MDIIAPRRSRAPSIETRRSITLLMAVLILALASCNPAGDQIGAGICQSAGDLVLTNGQILTIDQNDSIVSTVRVRGDRIAAVGDDIGEVDACTEIVDLAGRTVVPGLINVHAHYLRGGMRPGHDVRAIETAFSIPDLQAAIADRAASLPAASGDISGRDFISIVDAWNPAQFAEKRLPTLAELDRAAPDHAVFMMQYPAGPGATNSVGKSFLEMNGVSVADDGRLGGPPASTLTDAQTDYAVLARDQTLEDKKRSLTDIMQHSNTVGMSTILEGGGSFPGPGEFNEYTDYEAILALWREGELTVRFRAQLQSAARNAAGIDAIQARVDNTSMGLGDDMYRIAGFGENIVAETTPIQPMELFEEAFRIAAESGWIVHQHSIDVEELERHTTAFERVNRTIPIADLHWNLSHVFEIDEEILGRLDAMGAGVAVQMHWYHGSSPLGEVGPPYRRILDSGVPMGAGSDAGTYVPWVWIYHMTTGNTSSGEPILADQKITRMEALRISTLGSAWFALEEEALGSIEEGKLADLVVLSDDYLTVPDEDLRSLTSVLTLIGGEVVYSDGSLVACSPDQAGPWHRLDPEERCQIRPAG